MSDGENVTYHTITRTTLNDYGDATESDSTSTMRVLVVTSPDPKRSPFAFADLTNLNIILYSLSIMYEGDKVTWDSTEWRLTAVKKIDPETWAAVANRERN